MKKFLFVLLLVAGFLVPAQSVFAQTRQYPLLAQGQYFSIYSFPGIDYQQFLQKINYDNFSQVEPLSLEKDSPREVVARTLDAIYLEVSDTLGISVYSFKGNIKIFPDQAALSKEFRSMFGRDFPERAFYLHEKATLYLSYEDITIGMLVHEMAHVIMSNYFIVPPSQKLQEILSGYVEYHFRKRLNMLRVGM